MIEIFFLIPLELKIIIFGSIGSALYLIKYN